MRSTVSKALSRKAPDEGRVVEWAGRELVPHANAVEEALNQRYFQDFTHATTLTGVLEVAWTSDELNVEGTVELDVVVVGRATDGSSARYSMAGLFKRVAGGAASQVGATASLITPIEDVAGWDAQLGVSGNSITCEVKGDVARTVNWRVMVYMREMIA